MATTTARGVRINQFLGALESWVEDFPGLADEWEELEEGPRVSLSLQWDHLMTDYLTELDERYRAGEMTDGQAKRYRSLLIQLKTILPLIHDLKFYLPPVALDD